MVKDNGICGVGVAYNASLGGILWDSTAVISLSSHFAGIRLLGNSTTDAQDATALSYLPNRIDIYSNSWGPIDMGYFVDGPRNLTTQAIANGARSVSKLISMLIS